MKWYYELYANTFGILGNIDKNKIDYKVEQRRNKI